MSGQEEDNSQLSVRQFVVNGQPELIDVMNDDEAQREGKNNEANAENIKTQHSHRALARGFHFYTSNFSVLFLS